MTYRTNIRLKHYDYRTNGYYFVAALCGLLLISNFRFPIVLHAAGTTSANFLKIGVGARQAGMGEVFTGIADDVNAINWNVAGLATIEKKEFSAMHLEYFQDVKYESLNYVHPLESGALAFAAGYLYVSGIQKTIIDPNAYTGGWQYRDLDKFGADDRTFIAAYSRKVNENAHLGIALRYISETLDNVTASATSIDLGCLWRISERFTFGATAQNAGTGMKFISRSETLPVNFRAGAGYKSLNEKFTGGLDIVKPVDAELEIHIGSEYWLIRQDESDFGGLIIRGGYRLRGFDENYKLGYLSGLSVGVGMQVFNYRLDYAFIPYGDLGSTHRISLLGRF